MYFKQGLYAGKRGRYGLAEGPEGKWCDEGKSYHSMSLHEKTHAVTPGRTLTQPRTLTLILTLALALTLTLTLTRSRRACARA